MAVVALPALPALPNNSSNASSDNELPESPNRRSIRPAAIRAAAKVAAAVDNNSSSDSSSSKWESPTPEQLELFESPRQSTLRSAARVAAKKAARKAEEDKKNETEDEECGRNVLDDMIHKLGTRKEVEKDIRDHRRNRQGLEPSDDDQKCPTRGFGASSRDANYRENVHLLVGGGREKGFCAVLKCDHPKMELLHYCAACKQFIHILCSMANDLGGEDDCFYCSRHCHPS
jgi:hypothetical protein